MISKWVLALVAASALFIAETGYSFLIEAKPYEGNPVIIYAKPWMKTDLPNQGANVNFTSGQTTDQGYMVPMYITGLYFSLDTSDTVQLIQVTTHSLNKNYMIIGGPQNFTLQWGVMESKFVEVTITQTGGGENIPFLIQLYSSK